MRRRVLCTRTTPNAHPSIGAEATASRVWLHDESQPAIPHFCVSLLACKAATHGEKHQSSSRNFYVPNTLNRKCTMLVGSNERGIICRRLLRSASPFNQDARNSKHIQRCIRKALGRTGDAAFMQSGDRPDDSPGPIHEQRPTPCRNFQFISFSSRWSLSAHKLHFPSSNERRSW